MERHLPGARASLCLKLHFPNQEGIHYAKIDGGGVLLILIMEIGATCSQSLFKKIKIGVRLDRENFKSQTWNLPTFYVTWRQECIKQDALKSPTTPHQCSSACRGVSFYASLLWAWWCFSCCHCAASLLCASAPWDFIRTSFQCITSHRYFIEVESQAHASGKHLYAASSNFVWHPWECVVQCKLKYLFSTSFYFIP